MIRNRKFESRRFTLEQRIARLERLLQRDNKSCKNRIFESADSEFSPALDADDNVITPSSMVIDADGETWEVIKVAPLDVMLNKAFFDNRREVSKYINDNSLYDRNLMQRTVVLLRDPGTQDDPEQVLCLEPEILTLVNN